MGDKGKKSPQHKNSVTKAWLQFQEDIEAALFRKPSNNGLYKNLSDMLRNRMDQLEQVIIPFFVCKINRYERKIMKIITRYLKAV